MMATSIAILAMLSSVARGAPSHPCRITPVVFEGWQGQQISNDWVKLTIVPQLGGRLMQVSFGGHDYLFVNPKYKGKYIPPSEAGEKWINYGGDKIWPLPEGDEDDHHWVLKSDPLDDGEYSFRETSQGKRCSALLEGPPDPVTGLRYSREIGIGSDSPAISFHAVMKNISDHPIEWSVQSVSQYDLADREKPTDFNRDFYAFTPVSQPSAYFASYQVRDGLADDPSFEVKDGMFRLHWLYLENEVWLDSPAGWLAIADRQTHYAMVERFKYQPQANYPGKATVIFYKNGVSLGLDDKLMPRLERTSPGETPYYMEAELNSPMVSLRPGESYAFDTQWFPTRTGRDFSTVTEAGVVEVPLSATRSAKALAISGVFGVFFAGKVDAVFLDRGDAEIGRLKVAVANPLELLTLQSQIEAPHQTTRVSLHLVDEAGRDRGVLGIADVKQNPGGAA
jgi:hypothetical protein